MLYATFIMKVPLYHPWSNYYQNLSFTWAGYFLRMQILLLTLPWH